MSEFEIYNCKCKEISEELNEIGKKMETSQQKVEKVLKRLNNRNFNYVDVQLKNTSTSLMNSKRHFDNLSTALNSSVGVYEKTENSILGLDLPNMEDSEDTNSIFSEDFSISEFLQYIIMFGISPGSALFFWLYSLYKKNKKTTPYLLNSILFDENGSYGGNQGNMISEYKTNYDRKMELLQDLREYFPDMTEEEGYQYLAHLNSTGCGYTALVNTIFMQFEGDPQGFENTFGFSMYRDGDLNYDRLLLDLYATTDLADIHDGNDGLLKGLPVKGVDEILNNYLSDKGITATTKEDANITVNNAKEICDNGGKIIVALFDDNIYRVDGSPHHISAHGMVITGVTDDGKYVVSSWGDMYYINPSELDRNDSFIVVNYN